MSRHSNRPIQTILLSTARVCLVAGLLFSVDAVCADKGTGKVIVNGQVLSRETLSELRRLYPVPIAAGHYWYDPMTGAYGIEGQAVAGQMLPGLALGGPLRADASHGTSGVFINGRELTLGEKSYLEQTCRTPAIPGRYWVNAQGLGGVEGAPPSFNLSLCGTTSSRRRGGSSTDTYCDPDGSCRSSGILGSIITAPQ